MYQTKLTILEDLEETFDLIIALVAYLIGAYIPMKLLLIMEIKRKCQIRKCVFIAFTSIDFGSFN